MKMYLVNLTPHDVNICDKNGRITKIYRASGKVARINNGYDTVDYINGVPLMVRRDNNSVVDLPEPKEGIMYIVSNIVLDHCKDRADLIAPAYQVKVNGRVVGCTAFVSNR